MSGGSGQTVTCRLESLCLHDDVLADFALCCLAIRRCGRRFRSGLRRAGAASRAYVHARVFCGASTWRNVRT